MRVVITGTICCSFLSVCEKGIEDSGSEWVDAGDAWVSGGTWDKTMTGEALVCVYETKDYTNNACSEVTFPFSLFYIGRSRHLMG